MEDPRSLETLLDMYDSDEANERCWESGSYNDNCDCNLCIHSHECSAGNDE